jgi:hypothetical protein
MQLNVDIEFNELMNIIRQLPASQIEKIKTEVNDNIIFDKQKIEISDFQEFLLSGPIMTDKQYEEYLENRQQFTKWRSE